MGMEQDQKSVELPAPTAWPIVLALGTALLFTGLLTSAAAGQFPYLLGSLTVYNAGSSPHIMSFSALWWLPAFVLAGAYNVYLHLMSRNKLEAKSRLADAYPRPMMTAGN